VGSKNKYFAMWFKKRELVRTVLLEGARIQIRTTPIKSICDFHILDTKSDHFMELGNKYSDLYQL